MSSQSMVQWATQKYNSHICSIQTFIALFALHVLCNIKTAMKNIPTNPFLITGYQGPDYFCDRENA